MTDAFSNLERVHKQRVAKLKQQSEQQYNQTCQQSQVAVSALLQSTNGDIQNLIVKERQLEVELKEIQTQTELMHIRLQQWAQLFLKFNVALKELGDVGHWSKVVEADVED